MRYSPITLIACVLSLGAIAFGLSGCASTAGLPLAPQAEVLYPERLAEEDAWVEGQSKSAALVGMARQAQVWVLTSADDIPEYAYRHHDQVFFVLRGEGVVSLDGVRDFVQAGCIVVVPRRTRFMFQPRSEGPVTLASVLVLNNDASEPARPMLRSVDSEPGNPEGSFDSPTGGD